MKKKQNPKTILITGASSGIGKALALSYAEVDINLLLIARNHQRLSQVAKTCQQQGAHVEYATIDVTDAQALSEWILAKDQNYQIDLLIANAGISSGGANFTTELSQKLFDINFQGVLNTVHPVLPIMQSRGHGHIALMSSLSGYCVAAHATVYSATKAAIKDYGATLYGVLSNSGVAVSVICPGFIDTPLTEKNSFPMPGLMDLDEAVTIIRRGLRKAKPIIAFPRNVQFFSYFLGVLPVTWVQGYLARLFARLK